MFFSPLEQFELIPLISLQILHYNFFFTNLSLFIFFTFFLFIFLLKSIFNYDQRGFLVPNRWQYTLEIFYTLVLDIVKRNISGTTSGMFPLIFCLFIFILQANLFGLVPYSFTVTSHLSVTIFFSFSLWLGKLVLGFKKHGLRLFAFFLPKGAPFIMVPFLVLIEIVGFFIVIISLSVRLFANMMAGHILLKVLAGFSWVMLTQGGMLFYLHFLPLIVLFILFALELGVAFIQAYVFTLLVALYIDDMLVGGHLDLFFYALLSF